MSFNIGAAPVAGGQKVAANQKEIDPKRSFNVSWNRTSANVAQVVGISGVANITIGDPSKITVKILFNDHPYASAEQVEIKKDGRITAQWKVAPYKMGDFTAGSYDVEIRYKGTFSGKTTVPLKIASLGGDRNVSSFG